MKIAKSLFLSSYLFFTSASLALAQVATAPASPTPSPAGTPNGATTSPLPDAGMTGPTIILLVLGSFFLLLGGYKFFQAFKD